MKPSLERVLRTIHGAFESVPYPGYERIGHCERCYDEADIQMLQGVKDWRRIPKDAMANMGLAFFSPEGFRFFLPGLMTHALEHPHSEGVEVDFTVWGLGPPNLWHPGAAPQDVRAWRTKIASLDTAQRGAVVAFLEAMRDLSQDDEVRGEDVQKALDWWKAEQA